jgi:hypothetical protein
LPLRQKEDSLFKGDLNLCLQRHPERVYPMKSKTEMLAFNKKIKLGRNDACPCGSGLKYKKCCLGKIEPSLVDIKNSYKEKHKILLKDPADVKRPGRC